MIDPCYGTRLLREQEQADIDAERRGEENERRVQELCEELPDRLKGDLLFEAITEASGEELDAAVEEMVRFGPSGLGEAVMAIVQRHLRWLAERESE